MKSKTSPAKRFALTLTVALVALGLWLGPAAAATKMPQFSLPSARDGAVIDSGHYQGKVVLVNFFATWCPPCRKEIPGFIELQEELGNQGFVVIGLSVDQASSVVAKFIKKMNINYPVAMADDQVTRDFGGVVGIPQSFLVDRHGNVVKSYMGYVGEATLTKDIKSVMVE